MIEKGRFQRIHPGSVAYLRKISYPAGTSADQRITAMILRKLLPTLVVLGLAAAGVQAQPTNPYEREDLYRGLHLGLTVGGNHAVIRNPFDAPDPQLAAALHVGPSLGVLAGYHFDDVFGLRLGLLYTRLGRTGEEAFLIDGQPQAFEKIVDLDYVQVPVLVRAAVGQSLDTFYIQAGVVYSRLLSASVERNGQTQSDADRLFGKTDLGLMAEAGPSRSISDRLYLTLGARVYLGLSDINADDLDTTGFLVGKSQNLAAGLHLTLNALRRAPR